MKTKTEKTILVAIGTVLCTVPPFVPVLAPLAIPLGILGGLLGGKALLRRPGDVPRPR